MLMLAGVLRGMGPAVARSIGAAGNPRALVHWFGMQWMCRAGAWAGTRWAG